jgi:ABC-type cobalamin/Fe3+-siderophores transport system ATPase subunit
MVVFKDVTFTYPDGKNPVFKNLSLELPDGVISFIGQNGTGKSTLLLLAGGRLIPNEGSVLIDGRDTREFKTEEERAEYAAFIYQNLEFENEEPVGELLRFVYENGFYKEKDFSFIDELVEVFELARCLSLKTQELSKGELQRTILAFSLLYGSKYLLMDEPIFALEEYQKQRALSYLTDFVKKKNVKLYYSLHELDLSEKYSDHVLIFYNKKPPSLGRTSDLFKKEIIEEAYDVPFDLLKNKESIFRDTLIKFDELHRKEHGLL